MRTLNHALEGYRLMVIWNPGIEGRLPDWVLDWRGRYLEMFTPDRAIHGDEILSATIDLSTTLPLPADETLLLVAGQHGLFTRATIERLHDARPAMRLFTAIAAHTEDVDAILRASGGGRLSFTSFGTSAFTSLRLAISPGRDVAVTVHAERTSRDDTQPIERPPIIELDRLRVDAIAPHVDEPIFAVAATIQPPRMPWSITRFHTAWRAHATPPTDEQIAGVEVRAFAPRPATGPLPHEPYHPLSITGALVFEARGRTERVPLTSATHVTNASGAFDLEIIDDAVCITARHGTVRLRGARLRPRLIRTRLSSTELPFGVGLVNPGVTVELAAGESIEIGEVNLRVELTSVTLPGPPVTIVEHAATGPIRRIPRIIDVDGQPLSLIRAPDGDQLFLADRPLRTPGSDLWWLVAIARHGVPRTTSGARLPIDARAMITTPAGISHQHLTGAAIFDLRTLSVTLDARETFSDDR